MTGTSPAFSLASSARIRSFLCLLCALSFVAAGCGGSSDESDAGTTSSISDSDSPDTTSADNPETDTEPDGPDAPAPEWAELELQLTLIGEFDEPIALSSRPGSTDLYVAERAGVIRRVQRTIDGFGIERVSLDTRTVLDLSELVRTSGEGGLLGLAFSTDGRYLFVNYTDTSGDTVIAEYDIERATVANFDSGRELLRIDQPDTNHNGGDLAMGPDGYLYVGMGDGGGSNDPDNNGQDPTTLLGSMLRIDPFADGDDAYIIPPGNPFSDSTEGADEVWLYGLRNPWRFSFDSQTGDLWISDVGQDGQEEINLLTEGVDDLGRGANLGWSLAEGADVSSEAPENLVSPTYSYPHEDDACSITGGYVSRGAALPELAGVYVFGDYCTGEINGLSITEGVVQVAPLTVEAKGNQLVSFGEGPDGALYVIESGGQLLRIERFVPEAVEE